MQMRPGWLLSLLIAVVAAAAVLFGLRAARLHAGHADTARNAAAQAPLGPGWMERTEAIMGTRCYVTLLANDPVKGNAAIDAVMAELRRIDNLMSHYKPESQLSQINAHANEEPVQVDKELFDLIKLSTYYSQITDGAFDITYAAVGHLYDFRHHIHPTEEQIRAALPSVNWRNMQLDEAHHTVRFMHPGMRIDLGGIGKGYAVDRGVEVLKAHGITHAVVTAGGDTRIIGDHMGRPWLVAIRHPDVKLILAHLGHPYEGECVVVIRKHPNVFADISALHYRPFQFYHSLMLVQEYGVWDKLLFGTDYPFTTVNATLDGLRSLNTMLDGTALPRLNEEKIEAMIARDTLTLLGIE